MSAFTMGGVKKATPWFVKIPAKIILSRLPIGYRRWQRLNLFRAGAMDTPAYALDIFKKHFDASGIADLRGCTVLELGPGNSVLTALYARCFGAARTWLVDSQKLVSNDMALFAEAQWMLSESQLPVSTLKPASSWEEALEQLNAVYLTEGLASLQTIPDGQVDFLFSNAVLEHVRLGDFVKIARETRRVLKKSGVASHVIDFRDHLQNALNNLRFSEKLWESEFMARSGFYTNRLTWPTMERLFQEAGFDVELRWSERWPDGLPTKQRKMASPFRNMAPEDLMLSLAHVVLRPAG